MHKRDANEQMDVRLGRGYRFQVWLSSLHHNSGFNGMFNIPVKLSEQLGLNHAAFFVSVIKGILYELTYEANYSHFADVFGWDAKITWAIEVYFLRLGYIVRQELPNDEFKYAITCQGEKFIFDLIEQDGEEHQ
jgi:hypothetical protein